MYDDVMAKWRMNDKVPLDILFERLDQLEARVKVLEEENIETTNVLYEIMENIRAVDARIDILFEEFTK